MRILVVEDERRVANFVCRALRENAYAVDHADTGEKALDMATGTSYDSILLDVRLPGLSGIQVCRELRDAKIDTPILMLTARGLVEQRVEGLDAGADDYLTKPFAVAELLARVRALVRRRVSKGGPVLRYADIELDRQQRRVRRSGRPLALTAKEFALLEFLMGRAPDVASRTEIVEHVWDAQFDSETNLVEVYINRLRQKISGPGSPKIIHTVHGVGYCMKVAE
ncbi:MAG TPA: response regulator transcription factor [Terriglobia bacterium]|nr:response regulator transcription factor [Terriglobia bacterium]